MKNTTTPNFPRVVTTCAEAYRAVQDARAAGKSVGVVPTMGALHEGHLSLARASHAECDFTVATIFVNPTQFGPKEDLARYPRTLDVDLQSLASCNADLVFVPTNEEMYPAGFSTYVEPPQAAQPFDGQLRPGHFRGVCTVVLKLFNVIPADRAYFGQKDYQQSLVIRRMVLDLNLPTQIRVCPIVREPDGLAMSSRNRYLSSAERQQALALSRSLRLAVDCFLPERLPKSLETSEVLYPISQGERHPEALREKMRHVLTDAGISQIDYIAFVEPETLAEVVEIVPGTVVLIAARVGTTRLIDNVILG
jgi:pantoate--beta-alanine ligase